MKATEAEMFNSFVEYGRRLMLLVDEIMVDLKVPEMMAKAPLLAAASYESLVRA